MADNYFNRNFEFSWINRSNLFFSIIAFILILLILIPLPKKQEPLYNTTLSQKPTAQNIQISKPLLIPTPQVPVNPLSFTLKPGDTLLKIFSQANISQQDFSLLFASQEIKNELLNIRAGQTIRFFKNKKDRLVRVVYKINHQENLVLYKDAGKFKQKYILNSLDIKQVSSGFTITSSLVQDAAKNHVPSKITKQLTDLLFTSSKQIMPGTKIKLLYQKLYDENQPVDTGNLIAAKIVSGQKNYEAIRYQDHFYDKNGISLTPAFERFPLRFTRISSRFSIKRWNPILHIYRPHEGVDLAAPIGTPIRATSNGIIAEETRDAGYGNFIVIKHDNTYSTLYAHISRFGKNITPGTHVSQGQIIGYVGETGLSTGPHLHYEFRVNGVHKDPLKVKLPSDRIVSKSKLIAFNMLKARVDSALNSTSSS